MLRSVLLNIWILQAPYISLILYSPLLCSTDCCAWWHALPVVHTLSGAIRVADISWVLFVQLLHKLIATYIVLLHASHSNGSLDLCQNCHKETLIQEVYLMIFASGYKPMKQILLSCYYHYIVQSIITIFLLMWP